jgi:hypothetical protein
MRAEANLAGGRERAMARSARPVVLLAVIAVLAGCTGPGVDKAGETQARQPLVLTLASFMRNGKCAHQRNRTLLSIVSNVVRNASLGEALLVRAQASSVLLPTGITAIRLMNSG